MAQQEQMITRPRSQSYTFPSTTRVTSNSLPNTPDSSQQNRKKVPLSVLKGSKSSQSTPRIHSGSFKDPMSRVYTVSNSDIHVDENIDEIQALLEKKLSRNATPNTSKIDLLSYNDKKSD